MLCPYRGVHAQMSFERVRRVRVPSCDCVNYNLPYRSLEFEHMSRLILARGDDVDVQPVRSVVAPPDRARDDEDERNGECDGERETQSSVIDLQDAACLAMIADRGLLPTGVPRHAEIVHNVHAV